MNYGCKTDFDVSGDYEEVAVVHFIIDKTDTTHFLKLNKTFLGEGNANVFAQVPDSSYFDNVEARVMEVDPGSGDITREWLLKDTIIENKEPGAFYYPEQLLYCFNAHDLDPTKRYRLHIDIENGKHIVTSQEGSDLELVDGVSMTSPIQNIPFRFYHNGEYATQSIRFSLGNAHIYNTQFFFRYRERNNDGTSSIETMRWNLGDLNKDNIIGTNGSAMASGERFYELVREQVVENSEVFQRRVHEIETLITAGSEELHLYMLTNQPTSGLTQNKPEYSNVDGGLGIFTSRLTVNQIKPVHVQESNARALSTQSTDYLCRGPVTVHLDFCSHIPPDQDSDFSCN